MMTWYCFDCKEGFEKPNYAAIESGEFWGMPYIRTAPVCAYCDGDNITGDPKEMPNEKDNMDE